MYTPSPHLVFSAPPATDGALVFGADQAPPPPALATGSLAASFPVRAVTASGSAAAIALGSMQAAAPLQTAVAATGSSAQYLSLTERPIVSQARAQHQDAAEANGGISTRHQDATGLLDGARARHQDAAPTDTPVTHKMAGKIVPLYVPTAAGHHDATGLQAGASAQHQDGTPATADASASHQDATPAQRSTAFPHQDGTPIHRAGTARHGDARGISLHRRAHHRPGTPRGRQWHTRYQDGRTPPAGRTPYPVKPTQPPPYQGNPLLVFACPPATDGALVFGRVCGLPAGPAALVVIPVLKAYMTINSIDLRRVAGNVELPAHTFRMELDADSWTWSWSATLDRATVALLQPIAGQPVELEAMVNGVPYRLLVGGISRKTTFPQQRILVRGRGLASALAQPNAPSTTHFNATAMTAQQLMHQVLTLNGVSTGWGIDWALDDWLVPAGAWSVKGTPMDALVDIAGAAGGYIQPHPTDATLRVLHRYPVAPWDWADAIPDLELPHDVVDVEDLDWIDKPAYNRVFLGGVGAGVFGPVTRVGTEGEVLAPQVTHPLITDVAAHRQRGLAVLADTGRQMHMSLKLPVLAETGLILPGKLIRYVTDQTHVGMVRSVSLDWSSPVMRQTIGVESHAA